MSERNGYEHGVPCWVDTWQSDADAAAARVRAAGGPVPIEPFESLEGGRIAIVADPAGAHLGIWQVGEHRGAELVNEDTPVGRQAVLADPAGAAFSVSTVNVPG